MSSVTRCVRLAGCGGAAGDRRLAAGVSVREAPWCPSKAPGELVAGAPVVERPWSAGGVPGTGEGSRSNAPRGPGPACCTTRGLRVSDAVQDGYRI